jgi:hypothetical protein
MSIKEYFSVMEYADEKSSGKRLCRFHIKLLDIEKFFCKVYDDLFSF